MMSSWFGVWLEKDICTHQKQCHKTKQEAEATLDFQVFSVPVHRVRYIFYFILFLKNNFLKLTIKSVFKPILCY